MNLWDAVLHEMKHYAHRKSQGGAYAGTALHNAQVIAEYACKVDLKQISLEEAWRHLVALHVMAPSVHLSTACAEDMTAQKM